MHSEWQGRLAQATVGAEEFRLSQGQLARNLSSTSLQATYENEMEGNCLALQHRAWATSPCPNPSRPLWAGWASQRTAEIGAGYFGPDTIQFILLHQSA